MTVTEQRSVALGSIASVRVDEISIPLPQPVRNGTALIASRDYVLVTVTDENGGSGTAGALRRGVSIRPVIESLISPILIGRSASEVQHLWQTIYKAGELFHGRSGAFVRALSLVDIALWDLAGKNAGLSLAAQLGGAGAPVSMLMAIGYYRDLEETSHTKGIDLLVADYDALVARGFRRFKIMAGGASLGTDVERIRAVASALPADATLAVDVNGSWSSGKQALRFMDAVDVDFDFVEDPFTPDNEAALRLFRKHSSVPVAVGEWESGRHRFRELLERDLIDVARIDATACGGISEWLKIAALALAFDKRVIPHYYPELHLPLAAATPGTEAVEVVPVLTGADNFESLLTSQSWAEEPMARPSTEPGLGVHWDWDFIREHAN